MSHKRKMHTAHSLEQAANSDNSLEGYAAMNTDSRSEIAKLAYQFYEERGRGDGKADDDWFRAEREFQSRNNNGVGRGPAQWQPAAAQIAR